ncbi:accessory Sec system translocase SecA2 [Halobacillus halophilus]|uniref:accessory Sec system translocase SecA2 n=1 Tax=Halobacillus halophilus TaxID=1570 RepID=UPI001CD444D1|nr:accessory Sec system translocase SecA2 [Halobacillus halophilus]MCA1010738.1 accessory Sec system translocase SecA2 [Halobacillus halophilus]
MMKKFFPEKRGREWKNYEQELRTINRWEATMIALSDEELRARTSEFKRYLREGQSIYDIRAEAFALVREAARRVLGLRPYDVQILGGLIMSDGHIAEMATGEGKTLVAALSGYLFALEEKGVHLITANEYLAQRDYDLMSPLYDYLWISTGLNLNQISQTEKLEAYQADLTYGTGTAFGFDYLRDHLTRDQKNQVQRPYHVALIDEIDSVLIDEAKTPMIIAGKMEAHANLHKLGALVMRSFQKDADYQLDPETKAVHFTDQGIHKIERSFDIENLFDLQHQTLYHYMMQAVRARVLFHRDKDYVVEEQQIKLIDTFTGRLMEGRTLSDGLHQALEAKEGLAITEENKPQASITVQNFFRMYPRLAGMTGTAKTEENEFQSVYGMNVWPVPTNQPVLREDHPDQVYVTQADKYRAIVREVETVHASGQPILIGTSSILQSEYISSLLQEAGVRHELLNAKSVEQEARLISLAGQVGQVTIATNMAGRGTDIVLGEGAAARGGLHVIGTERHESRRIDNQLKGRAGRQGDPGSSRFMISLEDEIVERFGQTERDRKWKHPKTNEDGLILHRQIDAFMDTVQKISEGSQANIRASILKLDDVIHDQRTVVYGLRNQILQSEDPIGILAPMVLDDVDELVRTYCLEAAASEEWDLEKLEKDLKRVIPGIDSQLVQTDYEDQEEVISDLHALVERYQVMIQKWKNRPAVQHKVAQGALGVLDRHWIRHLDKMNRLKEGVGIRQYQQEDPVRLYQQDGFELFTQTFAAIRQDMVHWMADVLEPLENAKEESTRV